MQTRDELVETMARATYAEHMRRLAERDPTFLTECAVHGVATSWDDQNDAVREDGCAAARAALAAIEAKGAAVVPAKATQEMAFCGWGAGSYCGGELNFTADDANDLWRDMTAASPFREDA